MKGWIDMSDSNVKLTSQREPKLQAPEPSSYLLNVDVLNDLKHAIEEAKVTRSSGGKKSEK